MDKPLPNDAGLARSELAGLLEKQLRAMATMYKVMEMQHELLSKILVQQEAQTNWLIDIGERDRDMRPVKVEDINMPFWALVGFLAKMAFASIPAAIVLYITFFVVFAATVILALIFGFDPPPLF